MEYKSYIKGLRTAKLGSFLKEYCWVHDIELKMDIDKGVFRETVYFKVTGEVEQINKFKLDLDRSIEAYNQ